MFDGFPERRRSGREPMNTNTASNVGAGDNVLGPVRAGEVVADKYRIERALGIGGMGVVVAAKDLLLDRQVAIKFLLPKLAGSETAVQRFVREARAATRISSEHVVRLLEIEKLPSGTPFFVMEYLEGCDLRTLLRERGALAPSLAVDYVLQAVQAVAEGHVKGIVHRDIKPGNLFLTHRADGTPLIKVLDFGIAKTAESDAAESTALTSSDDVRLGSPAYMPPEQLQNPRDVDTRSDIWSLGATLYELLCGRPPFEGATYLDLASQVLNKPPLAFALQDMASPLPDGLEQVVRRCLEKDRDARYANAAELATALARYGSADARMSLTRVGGMFASSSSFPALTRAIAVDASATNCDPTLDVNEPSSKRGPDHRDTRDLNGKPPSKSSRSWVLVVAAAVALVAVVVSLRPPPAVPSEAPPAAAQPVRAALTPPPAVAESPKAPEKSVELGPASAVSPQPRVAPSARVAKGTKLPHTAATAPSAAASILSLPPPPEVVPVRASTNGRSAEIERLIERRR